MERAPLPHADDRALLPPRQSAFRSIAARAARRLLAAAGLTRAADLDGARRTVRVAERERAARAADAASARLASLGEKLRAAEERASAAHTRHKTTQGLLRHYLLRLARMESEVVERMALDRRVKRAQLAVGAREARRQPVSPSAAADGARFGSLSADYQVAASRWQSDSLPADLRRLDIAGLRWSVPAQKAPDAPTSDVDRWLPLDDLATIRQFTVGGVMLDIGAGLGAASIPRVIAGDFARAYATEPDGVTYLALVANTLDNHLDGRVLPDRLAICGSSRTVRVAGADGGVHELSSLTADSWLQRLGVAVDDVRFVRLAMQEWNLDALHGAASLLSNDRIVWQIEMSPPVLRAATSQLDDVFRGIDAHFTHLKELGRFGAGHSRQASDATDVFRALADERRAANVLFFNLPGTGGRKRSASEAPDRAEGLAQ